MDTEQRRTVVRGLLLRGVLPREKCLVTWFGPGSGQPCVGCGRTIGRHEVECECEHPSGGVLRFHQRCFATWESERDRGDLISR